MFNPWFETALATSEICPHDLECLFPFGAESYVFLFSNQAYKEFGCHFMYMGVKLGVS
jgi:hypothetical protein